jgi:methionyl aminopeptidase
VIHIRQTDEIGKIAASARIVAETLGMLAERIRPGVTPHELDDLAEAFIRSKGATPSFKGYYGYPASICVSVNDEVVHGIPGRRPLEEGDIVGVDVGAVKDGYHGDAARTFPVGKVDPAAEKLLRVTREALDRGIAKARPGGRLGDIGHAIQEHVEANGYSVVRSLVGHGIGREMHEEPQVPNFGKAGTGVALREGMALAIEPMVNAGGYEVVTLPDGWTVRTEDGSLSAHFEDTIAILADGPAVFSRL